MLKKTDGILNIIRDVHPHYLKDDYTHFLVLTQSCDLVQRGKAGSLACKARYITLAAVRHAALAIEREVATHQDAFAAAAGVCSDRKRALLRRFVGQLMNNNDPRYFYLHAQPEVGLTENECAFLRLSIAIKADLHYERCLDARVLSLNEAFRAKLGWLVGNLYSRVGTEDWVPGKVATDKELGGIIDATLDGWISWVDEKQLKAAKKSAPELDEVDRAELRLHIDNTVVKARKEKCLDRVVTVLGELAVVENDDDRDKIRKRLQNDPIFSQLTK